MANLIRLKQIESGSALTTAAAVNTDLTASVQNIVSQSLETSLSQSIVNIIVNNVGAVLPDGVVSGSSQIVLNETTGSITSSRLTGDIVANAIEYTNILNKPSLVSGSTQVIGILDSLNQFTSSLDNTFATDAELAVTTSNLSVDMGEF